MFLLCYIQDLLPSLNYNCLYLAVTRMHKNAEECVSERFQSLAGVTGQPVKECMT